MRLGAWSVGLKGVRPDKVAEVEDLILSELSRLAEEGIDPDTVEASINTVEFALREKNSGRFPRGLAVMLEALNEWLYDKDPIRALSFGASLAEIKKEATDGGVYFERLIRAWLLDNPHRSTVTILPDPEAGARREAEERAALEAARAAMSETDLKSAATAAEQLQLRQNAPDSPRGPRHHSLAGNWPTCRKTRREYPPKRERSLPHPALPRSSDQFHPLPGSGLPLEWAGRKAPPYMGLLGRALLEMGTEDADYVTMSQEIGKHTGGIGTTSVLTTKWNRPEARAYFVFRSKAIVEKVPQLLALLESILLGAKLDNRERFKQIVLEEKAQSEASLIPSGHRLVGLRLLSRLTEADRMSESINGLEQLFFLARSPRGSIPTGQACSPT